MLFVSLFWLAQPIMDAMQNGIAALGSFTTRHLVDGPIKDLLTDGIFKGVGAVVVFVPQIALLFLFLAILEDSGYLAASRVFDGSPAQQSRPARQKLHPLAEFIRLRHPRHHGHPHHRKPPRTPGHDPRRPLHELQRATAGLYAADRRVFRRCGRHFAQAGIMLACYGLGIIAAAGTAWIFKRTLTKGPATSFILELPIV